MPIQETPDLTLPASSITVLPGRQRTKLDVTELKESISRLGVLHPVVVRRDGDRVVLIAGERRRRACLELNRPVPVRFFESMSSLEADIVELEENLKRSDLSWQDQVRAMGRIHQLYLDQDPTWDRTKTAQAIGVSPANVTGMLTVFEHLHEDGILKQPGWTSAYNAITRANSRAADVVMANLLEQASVAFVPSKPTPTALPPTPTVPPSATLVAPPSVVALPAPPIEQGDFLTWAPTYTGPKFNLLHCDFPYGIGVFRPGGHIGLGGSAQVEYGDTEEIYFQLLTCLMTNLDRLLSHSAHVVFWFSMQHYERTLRTLSQHLTVFPLPLVWLRSDNAGVAPDPKRGPRQIYETALLAYRGDRNIVKIVSNGFFGPSDKTIHPSAKPVPTLKHFFTMLVDGTTRLLDPTAGGGSAIRAAEALGAEFTFGLEINPDHVENANAAIRSDRIVRGLAKPRLEAAQ